MDIKKIIEGVLVDLTCDESISKILLKAQTIAFYLKNDEFTQLIRNESNGYDNIKDLPVYRLSKCEVKANVAFPFGRFINNQSIPIDQIVDEKVRMMCSRIYFMKPLSELEEMYKGQGVLRVNIPGFAFPELSKMFNEGQVIAAWQYTSITAAKAIVEKVKSLLLSFFLKINEKVNFDIDFDVMSNKNVVTSITYQTFNNSVIQSGDNNSINSDHSNMGGRNNQLVVDDKTELVDILKRIEELAEQLDENKDSIKEILADIHLEVDKKTYSKGVAKMGLMSLKHVISTVKDQLLRTSITTLVAKAIAICS